MSFHIQLNDNGVARVTFEGVVTMEDTKGALGALLRPSGFVSTRRLWDMRGCTLDISSAELRRMAWMGQEKDESPSRIALLVDEDFAFGLMRQGGVFRESDTVQVHVFRDEGQALRWLG